MDTLMGNFLTYGISYIFYLASYPYKTGYFFLVKSTKLLTPEIEWNFLKKFVPTIYYKNCFCKLDSSFFILNRTYKKLAISSQLHKSTKLLAPEIE